MRLCACSGDRSATDTADTGIVVATASGAFFSATLAFEFAFEFAFDIKLAFELSVAFACDNSLIDGNGSNGADDELEATAANATGEVTDDDDEDDDEVMIAV